MNRNTHWTATIAACGFALASLAATSAFAAETGDAAQNANVPLRDGASNPPAFERADADNNGLIEPDEVHRVGVPFPMLDTDGDGHVTRVEYLNGTAQYAIPNNALESHKQANRE